MALGMAVMAGLGIGQALMRRGKKARSTYDQNPRPSMASYGSFKSKYDDPSSKSIYDFYDRRIKGADLGYGKEDLAQMRAEAIDTSTQAGNEMLRRAGAGHRTRTGGMETGGAGRVQRSALSEMLTTRSKAMRDISISNAVLKHKDLWSAAEGMGGFRQEERRYQGQQFEGAAKKTLYDAGIADIRRQEADQVSALNRQRKSRFYDDMFGVGMSAVNPSATSWKSILSKQR